MKICVVETNFSHADGLTDRQEDGQKDGRKDRLKGITKAIVAFQKFTNAPKNY
jgi:hypothetical protein